MLVIKWLLHVNSCAHGAARDRANGRKRVIRQSRAPRGGMSVYGSFNQARSVCFNARGCDGCFKRVSLPRMSYPARGVGLWHAFDMRHA